MKISLKVKFKKLMSLRVLKLSWVLVVFVSFVTSVQATYNFDEPFNRNEFPNLFLLPGEKPDAARERLELAIGSVLSRAEGQLHNGNSFYSTSITHELQSIAVSVDPGAQVFISGGNLIGVIAKIYSILYEEYLKDPEGFDVERSMNIIINDQNPIENSTIRGVGSDYDVLVSSSGERFFEQIKKKFIELSGVQQINGLESEWVRMFYTILDVKPLSQIQFAFDQGGATIDTIAYNLGTGKLIEPEGGISIVDNLLKGSYEYVSPPIADASEVSAKQTLRGFRRLIQLPFLHVKNPQVLITEIRALKSKLTDGSIMLSKNDLSQIKKMSRNAMFSAGNNRFHRAGNSSSNEDLLNREIYSLLKLISEKSGHTVPKFIPFFPVGRGLELPKEFLMSRAEYQNRHTDNGVIYHGTNNVENLLSFLRGMFFLSGEGQGAAIMGSGVYFSDSKAVSFGYAEKAEAVIPVEVSNRSDLIILDYNKVTRSFLNNLEIEYPGQDINKVFREVYGVDIIVNDHTIIQNSSVLVLPKSTISILERIFQILLEDFIKNDKTVDIKTSAFLIDVYNILSTYTEPTAFLKQSHSLIIQHLEDNFPECHKHTVNLCNKVLNHFLSHYQKDIVKKMSLVSKFLTQTLLFHPTELLLKTLSIITNDSELINAIKESQLMKKIITVLITNLSNLDSTSVNNAKNIIKKVSLKLTSSEKSDLRVLLFNKFKETNPSANTLWGLTHILSLMGIQMNSLNTSELELIKKSVLNIIFNPGSVIAPPRVINSQQLTLEEGVWTVDNNIESLNIFYDFLRTKGFSFEWNMEMVKHASDSLLHAYQTRFSGATNRSIDKNKYLTRFLELRAPFEFKYQVIREVLMASSMSLSLHDSFKLIKNTSLGREISYKLAAELLKTKNYAALDNILGTQLLLYSMQREPKTAFHEELSKINNKIEQILKTNWQCKGLLSSH